MNQLMEIFTKILRSLLIEMYKIHSKLSPSFICDLISEFECHYQTRSHYKFTRNTDGAISEKKLMMKIPQVHKLIQVLKAFLILDRNIGTLCQKKRKNRIHWNRLNLN